jgi:deoxyribonuclease IV
MTRIGAHLTDPDPVARAQAIGAETVQFFLGDPQDWKPPQFPVEPDRLRAAGLDVYVHAPYRINVASPNNRIRIPSRNHLELYLRAAAEIGAKGLVVHGGYVPSGSDPADGYENWRKAVQRIERPVPMLIENTAGGAGQAMAHGLDGLARLWEAIGGAGDIGFCLDTCHAFASSVDLAGIVGRVKAVTGRIDLVHCNNSRDEFGSGRDRHAGLQDGHIEPKLLLDVVKAAGTAVICETPQPADDVRWLREQLTA